MYRITKGDLKITINVLKEIVRRQINPPITLYLDAILQTLENNKEQILEEHKTKYVGYYNGKKYDVYKIDTKNKNIGLYDVGGKITKAWGFFDRIIEREI